MLSWWNYTLLRLLTGIYKAIYTCNWVFLECFYYYYYCLYFIHVYVRSVSGQLIVSHRMHKLWLSRQGVRVHTSSPRTLRVPRGPFIREGTTCSCLWLWYRAHPLDTGNCCDVASTSFQRRIPRREVLRSQQRVSIVQAQCTIIIISMYKLRRLFVIFYSVIIYTQVTLCTKHSWPSRVSVPARKAVNSSSMSCVIIESRLNKIV